MIHRDGCSNKAIFKAAFSNFLATPTGLEPVTVGLEILLNAIFHAGYSVLVAPLSHSRYQRQGRLIQLFVVVVGNREQVPVNIGRNLDRTMPH